MQDDLFEKDHKESSSEIPLLKREWELWQSGYQAIAGVDEAGRGPLAGPVVACACILPRGVHFEGVQDSKALTPSKRKALSLLLQQDPRVTYAISVVSWEKIDEINILRASLLAMHEAVLALPRKADFVLIDGRDAPPLDIPNQAIIKGDATCQSIAAASIIAKVHRDELMDEYHKLYPHYGFNQHKGYGTKKHLDAIAEHGICPIHRKSFAPIRK